MKLDKLDFTVFTIVVVCLAAVAAAAYLSDPSRRPARVAYLYPALAAEQNVWWADIDKPGDHQQLTFSQGGVFDFDFSPDGRRLAFAERTSSGSVTLRLLDIPSGKLSDLVDCAAVNALCTAPMFSPSGEMLVYQRAEALGTSYGLSRIWLVNMTTAAL